MNSTSSQEQSSNMQRKEEETSSKSKPSRKGSGGRSPNKWEKKKKDRKQKSTSAKGNTLTSSPSTPSNAVSEDKVHQQANSKEEKKPINQYSTAVSKSTKNVGGENSSVFKGEMKTTEEDNNSIASKTEEVHSGTKIADSNSSIDKTNDSEMKEETHFGSTSTDPNVSIDTPVVLENEVTVNLSQQEQIIDSPENINLGENHDIRTREEADEHKVKSNASAAFGNSPNKEHGHTLSDFQNVQQNNFNDTINSTVSPNSFAYSLSVEIPKLKISTNNGETMITIEEPYASNDNSNSETCIITMTSEDDQGQLSSPTLINSSPTIPNRQNGKANTDTTNTTKSKNNKEKKQKSRSNSNAENSSRELSKKSPKISPSPSKSEAVTQLNVDTGSFIGRGRGLEGANNSCYMDATLFSLFYATNVFDDRLLTDAGSKGFPNKLSKEIRSILKEAIVHPLRQGYYCPQGNVWKLRNAMRNFNSKLCGSFMDAEEFIFLLFEDALNVIEFIYYTTGSSDFMHQIIVDNKDKREYATVQDLYETSMKILENLKLQSIPAPALLLEMPRSNRILVGYSGIVPNAQLDLNNVIVQCSLDNSSTDIEVSYASPDTRLCKVIKKAVSLYHSYVPNFIRRFTDVGCSTFFRICVWIFAFVRPIPIQRIEETMNHLVSVYGSKDNESQINTEKKMSLADVDAESPPDKILSQRTSKLMDLIAVICIRGVHYTSFVKYTDASDSHKATWLFFDSMAGSSPEVEEVQDCETWLRRLEKEPENIKKLWDEIPAGVKRIISDSHICIYKPAETTLRGVSNVICNIENETKM